jgi:uncharacterized repeat protein (TIGR01451 family)
VTFHLAFKHTLVLITLGLCAAVAFGAVTPAAPLVNVALTGSVLRAGQSLSLEEAGGVKPGEVISWQITVSNRGGGDANSLNVVGDIDDGTTYLPGSATGDGVVAVKYSLEHPHEHQTFTEHPIVREQVGGVLKERPALPQEFKAVQLTFARVAAGATLKAAYRTRVR